MDAELGRVPVEADVDSAVGLVLAGRAEHLDAARRERLRPPRGVEARVVGPEHPEQGLARDGIGQQAEVLRRRPRRVREVRDAQVGPQLDGWSCTVHEPGASILASIRVAAASVCVWVTEPHPTTITSPSKNLIGRAYRDPGFA